MGWTISKDFHFSAAHALDGLPTDHQCSRLHGHNYVVKVTLGSDQLTGPGFVMDYGDLTPLGDYLDTQMDHRNLNDALAFNPTAELMAEHLATMMVSGWGWPVVEVAVSETPKTWAAFRP